MTFAWTAEHIESLKTMWAAGRTCIDIANEFGEGLTKNAVIGKIGRLGLSGRGRVKTPKTEARPPLRQPPKIAALSPRPISPSVVVKPALPPRLPPLVEPSVPKRVTPVRTEAFDLATDRRTVDLFSLRVGQCRWPFGERPFRFCGAATADPINPECPYCAEHAALSRARPTGEAA